MEFKQLTEQEKKSRKARNYAIAIALALFVLLVFCTAIFRMQQHLPGA